jgi:hypothetical protein
MEWFHLTLCKWHHIGEELLEIGGDQDQPLLYRAAFECEDLLYRKPVQGVATEAIDRLGGVGDNSTLGYTAGRLTQPPVRH